MNEKQFHFIKLALENGGNGFYTTSINKEWNDLVNKGYATKDETFGANGMAFYRVTEEGKAKRSSFVISHTK
jgi:DNA-binding PadR family transcriptional regulator